MAFIVAHSILCPDSRLTIADRFRSAISGSISIAILQAQNGIDCVAGGQGLSARSELPGIILQQVVAICGVKT